MANSRARTVDVTVSLITAMESAVQYCNLSGPPRS